MTLVGNRPEWVSTMVACFRQGYVVLPCTEQLRAKDLRLRLEVAQPALVVCRRAQRARSCARRGWSGPTVCGARARRLAASDARRPTPSSTPRTRA